MIEVEEIKWDIFLDVPLSGQGLGSDFHEKRKEASSSMKDNKII
jgi:hypothetical protein